MQIAGHWKLITCKKLAGVLFGQSVQEVPGLRGTGGWQLHFPSWQRVSRHGHRERQAHPAARPLRRFYFGNTRWSSRIRTLGVRRGHIAQAVSGANRGLQNAVVIGRGGF
jgi:hypothetical protein